MWFIPHSSSKLRSEEFKPQRGTFPFTILPFSYPCSLSPPEGGSIPLYLPLPCMSSFPLFYCWIFFNMPLWLISSWPKWKTRPVANNNHLLLSCSWEEKNKQVLFIKASSLAVTHRRAAPELKEATLFLEKKRVSGIPIHLLGTGAGGKHYRNVIDVSSSKCSTVL